MTCRNAMRQAREWESLPRRAPWGKSSPSLHFLDGKSGALCPKKWGKSCPVEDSIWCIQSILVGVNGKAEDSHEFAENRANSKPVPVFPARGTPSFQQSKFISLYRGTPACQCLRGTLFGAPSAVTAKAGRTRQKARVKSRVPYRLPPRVART